jgi:hypothetical protein
MQVKATRQLAIRNTTGSPQLCPAGFAVAPPEGTVKWSDDFQVNTSTGGIYPSPGTESDGLPSAIVPPGNDPQYFLVIPAGVLLTAPGGFWAASTPEWGAAVSDGTLTVT